MNRLIVTASLLLAFTASQSLAALIPVFEYSFPASYDGSSSAINDLSSANNDATMWGDGTPGLIDDRPAGFDASLMSISGNGGGHGTTDAIDLLNTTAVEANGGFTMDVWFKWEGTYTSVRKIIDYAGTESLRTQDSEIRFGLSDSGTVLSHPIVGGQWYHAVAEFDTTGQTKEADPNYAGDFRILGQARLYIDDQLVDSSNGLVYKSGFGDSLNRKTGLNQWPQGGDWNQGSIFNPQVSLGVVAIPEASTLALLGVGGLALLWARMRR